MVTTDQSTEFGHGAGSFPRQDLDYSQGGYRSGFPIADPDRKQQFLDLRASKRTDLTNPAEPELPAFEGGQGPARMHYVPGNTERYGAQPPIVRQRRRPRYRRPDFLRKTHMERDN